MAEKDEGRHVRWDWVAMTACSLLLLIIGSMWQEKAKQAADDHAELGKTVIAVADVKKDVAAVSADVAAVSQSVNSLKEASNARWGALLDALPDVEKKLRHTTPVFAPEWHYDLKPGSDQR